MFRKKKTESNPDFEEFEYYCGWSIKNSDLIELGKTETRIILTSEFKTTFPKLTQLLSSARILNLKINNDLYKLYSWTKKDGLVCGWMNKFELQNQNNIEILPEHQMLLEEIGGIWESYNQAEPSLSNNQEFLFIKSECLKGLSGSGGYYKRMCKQNNSKEIAYKEFVSFVQEANGNLTLYNPQNGEILLFAHDHYFDNVEPLPNQPEYTFYKIKEVETFKDYVEVLASEWIREIEG